MGHPKEDKGEVMKCEGMKCQDMLKQLSEYIDGELDPKLCEELERHMEDCHPCLVFVNTLKKTISLFKYASSEPLPKEVHLRLHDYLKKRCQGECKDEVP